MRLQVACFSLLLTLGMSVAQANAQYFPQGAQPVSAPSSGSPIASIRDWFNKYDAVRRQAQMNPDERRRCDDMMSKGLSVVMPGADKAQMQQFLAKLVQRNKAAADQLKNMPLYPETEKLHRGYYKYFNDASNLFGDYMKVQDSLFATDPSGKPIAGTLPMRKQALEDLDQSNKALDAQLREKFGIPAYHY